MNVEDFLTDKQSEKIYYSNNQNSDEQINEQIKSFLEELYERRRDDYEDEELQAGMLIMPNVFASKVTENYGKDPHEITKINLLRFIKGKKDFYIRKAGHYSSIISDEKSEIYKNAIEVAIHDSEESLKLEIQSKSNIQTRFQLTVLKKLIDNLWHIKLNNLFQYVEIGFYSPISAVEVEDLQDIYRELNEALEIEEKKLEERQNKKNGEER